MTVKRSENYLYFQNKAQHYHNVQTAKSKVEHQLSLPMRRTLDHSQHITNRDIPYHQQYEIDFQNKNLANRILSISTTPRKLVEVQGSYSRFNKFERNFRRKNPYREEEQRQISLENDKIKKHIHASKPRIGSNDGWQAQYKDKFNYRRLRSRYDDNKSRGDLQIEKEPFLLDPYLKYIEQLSPSGSDKNLPFTEGLSSSRPKHVRLEKEKLFILPTFSHDTPIPLPQPQSKDTLIPNPN